MSNKYLKIKYSIGDGEFELTEKELKGQLSDIYDPEERIVYKNVGIRLMESDKENSDGNEILWIRGILFDDEYMINNGIDSFEVYDSISGDTYDLYETIYDDDSLKEEYYSILSSNIFYLDRIYVNKEYRNNGYATNILNKLDEILRYILKLNVGLVIIYSKPFELTSNGMNNVNDHKVQKRLDKLYEKCGYINIEKTKYYYKKIE